jgi:hypothetical protein
MHSRLKWLKKVISKLGHVGQEHKCEAWFHITLFLSMRVVADMGLGGSCMP